MSSAFLIDYLVMLRNMAFSDDLNYLVFISTDGYRFEVTQTGPDLFTVSHYASLTGNHPVQESTAAGNLVRDLLCEVPPGLKPRKVVLYQEGTCVQRYDW